jgi:hypothetical protein
MNLLIIEENLFYLKLQSFGLIMEFLLDIGPFVVHAKWILLAMDWQMNSYVRFSRLF